MRLNKKINDGSREEVVKAPHMNENANPTLLVSDSALSSDDEGKLDRVKNFADEFSEEESDSPIVNKTNERIALIDYNIGRSIATLGEFVSKVRSSTNEQNEHLRWVKKFSETDR